MMDLAPDILRAMREHAAREAPREACGVVIAERGAHRYIPCRNLAPGLDHFQADPHDLAAAEVRGRIVAVFHSHPGASNLPSAADIVTADEWGVPWFIEGADGMHEHRPAGYHPPLLGRVFEHGRLDCYSLVRDYFLEMLGIELPDFTRPDDWWANGGNLYLDNFAAAGFIDVTGQDLRQHDVPLMQLRATVVNHGGVYLGNGQLLHHAPGRLSKRDGYSGFWAGITQRVVRHRSLL